MREIRFRGKEYGYGWREGIFIKRAGCATIEDGCFFCVDPETVGQYTGFKDVNGKDIFEGDIVTDKMFNRLMVVEFHNAAFKFKAIKETNFVWADMWQWFEGPGKRETDCEVIGNIYDNPELLNGDANG